MNRFTRKHFRFRRHRRLPRLVIGFPNGSHLFLFARTFGVHQRFTRLFAKANRFRLGTFTLTSIPSGPIPSVHTVLRPPNSNFSLNPTLFTKTHRSTTLPQPITINIRHIILDLIVAHLIIQVRRTTRTFVTVHGDHQHMASRTLTTLTSMNGISLTYRQHTLRAGSRSQCINNGPLRPHLTFLRHN